ncbi:MAG: thiamine phosphate synthase [Oscillospiraceae bacterium]|nr:thiamine phosphate synthase [Oscillospiraceae bacterium]
MKPNIDYTLYLVTDRGLMSAESIESCVGRSVAGGCTVVQLREKDAPSLEFYKTAIRVREITARLGVPLIINDRADIALAVGANGLHVGQDDLPYEAARKIVGHEMVVGVSAGNLEQALAAAHAGADYLGLGAFFATDTKTDATLMSIDELKLIRRQVSIPLVAIGGINKATIPQFASSGIDGIAVVSAVVSQPDETAAARELRELFESVCRS